MSRLIGDDLPAALLSRLSPVRAVDEADRAIVICSVDDAGFPYPAMLSSLEMVAVDASTIRLALASASRTASNFHANRHVTLIVADERGVYYIKATASLVRSGMQPAPELAAYELRVDAVLQDDAATHEGARVVSGIRVERDALDEPRSQRILAELTKRPISWTRVPEA